LSSDRENEEEEARRALLQEARDCLVTNGAPPVFITRMLELLDGEFSAKELSYARPPEAHRWPTFTMVASWMVGFVVAVLLLPVPNGKELVDANVLDIVLISSVQIPFLAASALFLRSRFARKSIEDDALAVCVRLVPKTWTYRGIYKQIRNTPMSTTSDVDAYLRQHGWHGWSGARIWYLFHVLVYLGSIYMLYKLSHGAAAS